ncbi:interleukin-1 receptor-like 1 isoform X1 [Osmerus eperlanus]|uniref:interleukin-1 receptor-like 1 isoform X1 n=1 Tax=Osmerus eperlanus TaxID=29151 RepID=UPI002E136B33
MSVPIRACLLLALAWVSTCGEVTEPPDESPTEELCLQDEWDSLQVLEGEGLRLHAKVSNAILADANVTDPRWYRNGTEEISSSEGQRLHQHGSLLLFLPLLLNDSEHYYSYGRASPDRCFLFVTKVTVLPAEPRPRVLFPPVSESSVNIDIEWPVHRLGECKGNFSWYRNLRLLPSEKRSFLWVRNATKADEANYTCVCTWTHNQEVYNSSASRWLDVREPLAYYPPIINTPANGSTETAVMGSIKTLTCSAHCGINIEDCMVWWNVNEQKADDLEGYSQNLTRSTHTHIHYIVLVRISCLLMNSLICLFYIYSEYVTTKKLNIFKSVLTIDRVSAKDFHSKFECKAMTDQSNTVAVLFLKPEASLLLPLVGKVCVLLLALLAALAIRHFAIDLALFFRWLLRSYSRPEAPGTRPGHGGETGPVCHQGSALCPGEPVRPPPLHPRQRQPARRGLHGAGGEVHTAEQEADGHPHPDLRVRVGVRGQWSGCCAAVRLAAGASPCPDAEWGDCDPDSAGGHELHTPAPHPAAADPQQRPPQVVWGSAGRYHGYIGLLEAGEVPDAHCCTSQQAETPAGTPAVRDTLPD